MIFYEAPHKLAATLKDMASVFGSRETAVVRELTKIHEQVIRTTLDSAARHFAENTAKGEFVIIVKGCETAEIQEQMTFEQAVELARASVEGGMNVSLAAKEAAKISGFKKGDIYKQLISD